MLTEGAEKGVLALEPTVEVEWVRVASRANLWMKAWSFGAWLSAVCLAWGGLDARQIDVCPCFWARTRRLPRLPLVYRVWGATCAWLRDSRRAAEIPPEAEAPVLPQENALVQRLVFLMQMGLLTLHQMEQPHGLHVWVLRMRMLVLTLMPGLSQRQISSQCPYPESPLLVVVTPPWHLYLSV